ncbi:MAG: PP2C family protein-serine/threonine phosphatase [Calditrichaceae bacterium]
MQNIIDRLEIQVASLQESFSILSRAKDLEDLAKKFFQILRGNLLVTEINVYFKKKNENQWYELFVKNKNTSQCFDFLNESDEFSIQYPNNPDFQVCIRQPLIDQSVFGILLGKKFDNSGYNEIDKLTLPFFLQQLDSAYQYYISRQKEKQLIFTLNQRVVQLNSLIETGIEIAKLQEEDYLLNFALERVLAQTNASRALLKVKEGRTVLKKMYFPVHFKSKALENSPYSISSEFKFLDKKYSFHLFEKESRNGFIKFDETDRLLLDAFVRQVNVSLENRYLYEQSLEKERVEQEISVAGTIQKKVIPDKLPDIDGFDIAGINIPTKHVGGDYYDCFQLNDGRYALVIADVSGKGIPAALLVSTLQASMHAYMDSPFQLAELVQKLNTVIYNAATIEKYITAFFAILNPETGELETVSAGHNPTYIIRDKNKIEELSTGGIPLGMMGLPFPYTAKTSNLNPGDRLLLYTDGVTETMNENEEEYEDVIGLLNFIKKQNSESAEVFIKKLYSDLIKFAGDTPQSDDITALYLIRKT